MAATHMQCVWVYNITGVCRDGYPKDPHLLPCSGWLSIGLWCARNLATRLKLDREQSDRKVTASIDKKNFTK